MKLETENIHFVSETNHKQNDLVSLSTCHNEDFTSIPVSATKQKLLMQTGHSVHACGMRDRYMVCCEGPSEKGSTLKGKNLLCFFPFRADPVSEGIHNNFNRIVSPENVPILLKF